MMDNLNTDATERVEIDVDPSHVWPRKRRAIWTHPGCLFVLGIIAMITGDWAIWHYRDHRLIMTASPIASDVGGLLGWPLGYEYRIGIDRPITDEELDQLKVLNHPPRFSYVGIHFRTCELGEDRLQEIKGVLSECSVFLSCDDTESDAANHSQ